MSGAFGDPQDVEAAFLEAARQGFPFVLLDLEGTVANRVLGRLPRERIDDVIVLAPDSGRPVPLAEELCGEAIAKLLGLFPGISTDELEICFRWVGGRERGALSSLLTALAEEATAPTWNLVSDEPAELASACNTALPSLLAAVADRHLRGALFGVSAPTFSETALVIIEAEGLDESWWAVWAALALVHPLHGDLLVCAPTAVSQAASDAAIKATGRTVCLGARLAPGGQPTSLLASDAELAAAIRELSRLKYGRDRDIVDAEIVEAWSQDGHFLALDYDALAQLTRMAPAPAEFSAWLRSVAGGYRYTPTTINAIGWAQPEMEQLAVRALRGEG